MSNTREKLSFPTVASHWVIALVMIGMIAFGLILDDMPRSPDKGMLIGLHKSLGLLVLGLALIRVVMRVGDRFPDHVGSYSGWEINLSKFIVILLVLGTLLLPLSGIAMSLGGGHPVSFFGLFEFGSTDKNELLGKIGKIVHGLGGKLMIAAILIHMAGAFKHHFIDKDGTLKRITGRRVEIGSKA